jgi:hypothetical protein
LHFLIKEPNQNFVNIFAPDTYGVNVVYDFARQQFASGSLNWLSNPFSVALVNTALYGVLPHVHEHLIDVPVAARVAISTPLTGATANAGVLFANDITINNVIGPVIGAIIIYHNSGADTTSELICYIDTGIGLPWNPQGQNVVIHWDRGPNGICQI